MNTTATQLTPTQRYAKETADRTVDDNLAMITFAKRFAMFIVYPVMAVSYWHQRTFLLSKEADWLGALLLPLVFDAAIIFCVKVISTTGMAKPAKFVALGALFLPASASAWINFSASPNSFIGWVYVGAVAMIAVVETIKALMKPDLNALRAAEVSLTRAAITAEPAVDEELRARRSEAAKRGAQKRAADRAAEAARKAEAAAKRRAKRVAPDSPAWAIEGRPPTTEEYATIQA